MPILTVNNSLQSVVPLQDPAGITPFSVNIQPSATYVSASGVVSLDLLSRLEPVLNKMQTAGTLTWSVADDPNSQADSPAPALKTVLTTPYNALPDDKDIVVNLTSAGASSVVLSAAAPIGQRVTVVDGKGDAATNNITVSVASSGTINGASTNVISTNRGVATYLKTAAATWEKVG
jgi:hypothetical protein